MEKTIVLCGFMGCGKSSVAKRLNFYTRRTVIDTDEYIEEKMNMKISEIFEKYGESYFRDLEHKACDELSKEKKIIIATGGGALTFDRNADVIKKNGCDIVLLDTDVEEIKRRLEFDTKRPLLQCDNRFEVIENLYNKRMPLYLKASTIIVNGNQPLENVVHEVMVKTGILY